MIRSAFALVLIGIGAWFAITSGGVPWPRVAAIVLLVLAAAALLSRWAFEARLLCSVLLIGAAAFLDQADLPLAWAFLNTQFISAFIPAALVALVGYQYKRAVDRDRSELTDDRDRAQAAANLVDSDLDVESEVKSIKEQAADTVDFAEPSRDVQLIKDWINKRIAKLDGRRARKYEGLGNRDYRQQVFLLRKDRLQGDSAGLDDETADLLMHVLSLWKPFSTNRMPVPKRVASEIKKAVQHLEVASVPGA
jgi:hypothetical protein